jgi:hypothetical protein
MAEFEKGHKKVGGRKAGTPNKSTLQKLELAKIADARGLTPMDIFRANYERFYGLAEAAQADNDLPNEVTFRELAAENAARGAPYCHQRLSVHQVEGNQDRPVISQIRITIVDPNHKNA